MDLVEVTDAIRSIQVDFIEWPTLKLSLRQARRLWSLPIDVCETALLHLTDVGFLSLVDGVYLRRGLSRRPMVRRPEPDPRQAA
jgi:hypothetical protein